MANKPTETITDPRLLLDVAADAAKATNQVDVTYDSMIKDAETAFKGYEQQVDDWVSSQTKVQNEKTDFEIQKIEQQKEQTHKDYLKEQTGAYADWQKQSDQYGVEAEKMAAAGLTGSGYSANSQVKMYTAYQNRVATARASYDKAVQEYNNAMQNARIQNNVVLAEIASQAFQKKLEIGLKGFEYKNSLVLDKMNKKLEIQNTANSRYLETLRLINDEAYRKQQQENYLTDLELQKKEKDEQNKLSAATLLAENGNFTKLGEILGLSPADIKLLSTNYTAAKNEAKTDAEKADKLNAALLMAEAGDYTLIGEYYGLTKEQIAKLNSAAKGNTGAVNPIVGDPGDDPGDDPINDNPGGQLNGLWNWFTGLFGGGDYNIKNTANTDRFIKVTPTQREYMQTYAKEGKYSSYSDFVDKKLEEWLERGDLTQDEVATLVVHYNLA